MFLGLVFVFFSVFAWMQGGGGHVEEEERGLQECSLSEKRDGWCGVWQGRVRVERRGLRAVGGALRNAWKVSERSGRHWADNPAHHITIPSPTAPVSSWLSLPPLSLKPIRRARPMLTFACHVLPKKVPKWVGWWVGLDLMTDKLTIHCVGNCPSGSIKCT